MAPRGTKVPEEGGDDFVEVLAGIFDDNDGGTGGGSSSSSVKKELDFDATDDDMFQQAFPLGGQEDGEEGDSDGERGDKGDESTVTSEPVHSESGILQDRRVVCWARTPFVGPLKPRLPTCIGFTKSPGVRLILG